MKSKFAKLCSIILTISILSSLLSITSVNAKTTETMATGSLYDGSNFGNAKSINNVDDYMTYASESLPMASIYSTASTLPSSVDNSQSPFFPEIDTQGDLGSCVSWGQTYYQFTYEMNRSMGIATTPENTFSPKWTFNFANGGDDSGSWDDDTYELTKELGCVTLGMLPIDDDFLTWSPVEEIWKTALKYRIKDYQVFKAIGRSDSQITSVDDEDLLPIKTALANKEVLAVTSYIYCLEYDYLKTNPSVPENYKYEKQKVVTHKTGFTGRHRMAIVGYNDNIWTDINGNNAVDNGEMGAFKLANSWGKSYCNDGFIWVAYDALNEISYVSGGPQNDVRYRLFDDVTRIDVLPYDSDSSIYLKYTLNSCDRSQTKMYITAEKSDGTSYTYEAGPKRKHGMYNSTYSYDGTTEAHDGTMVYALSNVVPDITSETLDDYTWSVKFEDTKADGKVFTVKNAEIVDEKANRIFRPSNTYAFVLDGNTKTVSFPEVKTTTIGDANKDGNIKIGDATMVQMFIANWVDEADIDLKASDANKDSDISIVDATHIQLYIARLDGYAYVGEVITNTDDTYIEPETQPTTPQDNKVNFKNTLNWSGTISCYYWSDSNKSMTVWPGDAMTHTETDSSGNKIYSFDVPENATYIIFTNGTYQTVDVKYSGGNINYYPKFTPNSTGQYEVATY